MQEIATDDSREVKVVISDNCAFSDAICILEDQINNGNLEDECYCALDDQIFLNRWIVFMNEFKERKAINVFLEFKSFHFWFFFFIDIIFFIN